MNITDIDIDLLKEKGITIETLNEQLEMLRNGFPYLRIEACASPGNGLTVVSSDMEQRAVNIWDEYLKSGATVQKMVPASGAASRMFKDLFSFLNGRSDKPDNDFIKKFFNEIEKFAFFNHLNHEILTLYGRSIDTMIREGRYKEIVAALLENTGMGYGYLPKALLQFHKVMGGVRTPIEEHLAEAAQYASGKDGIARIHFTVSDEHIPLVLAKIEEVKARMEHEYGVTFDVTLSVQKSSTDTVAATPEGKPYRENGKLFFRPGGHGALIENLNDLTADVIFIKNIDNVVPDTLRTSTINFKKIIGGILVATKMTIDRYCRILEKGTPSAPELDEMLHFVRNVLCITHDDCDNMNDEEKAAYLFAKLNRPTRVCGMVRNEGEPGGGPFLCYNPDGTVSPQILESTQIDPKDKRSVKMLKESTHFNPVDLVCSIKNYKGEKFNLPDYVDKATGFISEKSREGVEIKALELPGLWNGAMSD
ncbi:MAG: DUF4301 family protein, partial [Muribaculaceae bacterium]|nr:DUF4301 family protein [Muribaculaceae bacterium]